MEERCWVQRYAKLARAPARAWEMKDRIMSVNLREEITF